MNFSTSREEMYYDYHLTQLQFVIEGFPHFCIKW